MARSPLCPTNLTRPECTPWGKDGLRTDPAIKTTKGEKYGPDDFVFLIIIFTTLLMALLLISLIIGLNQGKTL